MMQANKVTYENFNNWVQKERTGAAEVDSNTLLIDYVGHLIDRGTMNADSLRTVNKSRFKIFIEQMKDIKIGDIYRDIIDEAIDKSIGDMTNKKIFRNQFKRAIFYYALKDRLIISSYDAYFMNYKYQRHIENRNDICFEERTIGWYICESFYKKEQENVKIFPSDFTKHKQIFQPVWNLKPKEFSLDLIEFSENKKRYVRNFLLFLSGYGFSVDILKLSNLTDKPIVFDSNIWEIMDFNKRTKINFSDYSCDLNMVGYLKQWTRHRIQNKMKGHKKYLRLIKVYFIDYLKKCDIELLDFDNNQKRIWLSWLKEKVLNGDFKNGTIRNAVGSVKQFINFLKDINVSFKYDLTWLEGKDSIPDKSIKRKAYTQLELDKIVNALQYDTDKLFINIKKIILLTGRRLGEVLTLKHDCLVKIASVDCMRYTNSKISKETTFPLPTKKNQEDGESFLMDPGEIIIQAVNELLKIRSENLEFCYEEDREYLIIDRFDSFNFNGFLCGKITKSNFYSKLYAFKERNEIDFQLESHRFRNTIATKTIRTGGDVNIVSKILGNTPATVARHYESELSKKEILEKGSLFVVDAENNAKKLLKEMNSAPTVCSSSQSCKAAVPGGFCKDGIEAMLKCKYYNRLFSKGGCLGCSQLAVTIENKAFYMTLKENIIEELEWTSGTPAAKASMLKFKLVEKTLSRIENAKDTKWD